VPSIDTRLQRVEDRSVSDHEVIHGGPHVPWDQSVRGKLHTLMSERAAREQLRRAGLQRFSRTEALVLLGFGLIQTSIMVATFFVALHHG
jgi:hypothetical protein